jgi:hypothetical protein
MLRRTRLVVSMAALAVVAALAPSRARAQCMPDMLDSVACCMPVSAALPVFPAINQSAKFICFRDCNVQIDANLCVTIDAPVPALGTCGVYLIKFKVRLCGGAMPILFQGNLRAHYSRNWLETDSSGSTIGVWRFLLNGDMLATAFLQADPAWLSPNVQPGCYSTYGREYVAGYVDYAFDCTASTWTASWAFNHDCDRIHHPPSSQRAAPAGGYHPNRTWTFLGPGAGFVVDPVTTLTGMGPVADEAFRWNDWSTAPNICRGEEGMSGNVGVNGFFCPCATGPGAGQYDNTFISILGACGSGANPAMIPEVPMLQKRIGHWADPTTFPGFEYLDIVMGDLEYRNGCTFLGGMEFMEGVTTLGGFPAVSYGGLVFGRTQMDLGSSNRAPTLLTRRVGVPHVTQYLMNINMP